MRHAGAADGLDESFLDDAVLHVEGELAGALLRRAPTDTMRKAGNVADLLRLDHLPSSGMGAGPWYAPLQPGTYAVLQSCKSLQKSFPLFACVCGQAQKNDDFPAGQREVRSKTQLADSNRIIPIFLRNVNVDFDRLPDKMPPCGTVSPDKFHKSRKTAACAGHAAEWDPKYYWPAPSPP